MLRGVQTGFLGSQGLQRVLFGWCPVVFSMSPSAKKKFSKRVSDVQYKRSKNSLYLCWFENISEPFKKKSFSLMTHVVQTSRKM